MEHEHEDKTFLDLSNPKDFLDQPSSAWSIVTEARWEPQEGRWQGHGAHGAPQTRFLTFTDAPRGFQYYL